jgi:anti-sigma factor RsiW
MDKTCAEIRELIALGAETADNERIAIESHVSVCAECARELAESRALIGNLALLREGEMPAGTPEKIWRRVQSAVPGARRPAFLAWTVRAAAVLVIGLSVGYTAKSVAGRSVAAGAGIEDSVHDEAPPTVIKYRPSSSAFGVPSADPTGVPMIPQAATLHYLPSVDAVLDSDEVRF